MTRREEVTNSIKALNEMIDKITTLPLNQEQVMNVNLTSIAQQLGDINLTLAIIADKLEKEK